MNEPIIEGYWNTSGNRYPEYPMPVHSDTPIWGKEDLLGVLSMRETLAEKVAYRGFSTCRCCGIVTGSHEFVGNGFRWTSGLRHYIEVHNVMPSAAFLEMLCFEKVRMRREGYWNNAANAYPDYPMPVHSDEPFEGKDRVLMLLGRAQSAATMMGFMGVSKCRCCNIDNGNVEYILGRVVWPIGLQHYIQVHNVIPSDTFLQLLEQFDN